jgi:hypothetical protein
MTERQPSTGSRDHRCTERVMADLQGRTPVYFVGVRVILVVVMMR